MMHTEHIGLVTGREMERMRVQVNRWCHWWHRRSRTKLNGWQLGVEVVAAERSRLARRLAASLRMVPLPAYAKERLGL